MANIRAGQKLRCDWNSRSLSGKLKQGCKSHYFSIGVYSYMDQGGSATMLAAKTPDVNLRYALHINDNRGKRGIHHVYESQCRQHKKSKQGYH